MNSNEAFQRLISDAPCEPIDHVVQNFTRFLHDNAFDIFGKTYNNKSDTERKKVNDVWFEENCFEARRNFKTARNIYNPEKLTSRVLISYGHEHTITELRKRQSKIKEGRRINDLAKTQPRKFWQNIKKKTFKSTIGEPQINKHNIDENENISNDELDMEFTESELHSALFSQNNNKSPRIDSITSEILKASYDFTSPFLLYLYNRIFNTGEYPRAWG